MVTRSDTPKTEPSRKPPSGTAEGHAAATDLSRSVNACTFAVRWRDFWLRGIEEAADSGALPCPYQPLWECGWTRTKGEAKQFRADEITNELLARIPEGACVVGFESGALAIEKLA